MKVMIPGSFDPIHLGHVDIISQASSLFDEVMVVVMHNPEKPVGMFTVAQRIEMIKAVTKQFKGVSVHAAAGLAVDTAKKLGADCIVKSVRNVMDLDVEVQMAHTNQAISGLQTILLIPQPANSFISSRYIREIVVNGGSISAMVPGVVETMIAETRGK